MTRTLPGPHLYPHASTPPGQPPFPYGDPWARPGQRAVGYGQNPGHQQPYPGPRPVAPGFDFRPRPSGRGRMWVLLGSIAAGLLLVVIVIAALAPSGGDSPSDDHAGMVRLNPSATTAPGRDVAGDDEAEIQRLVDDVMSATAGATMADAAPYYCAAERKTISRLDMIDMPASSRSATVTNVNVRGEIAKAKVNGDAGYFRKESGEWKLCDSVKSEF